MPEIAPELGAALAALALLLIAAALWVTQQLLNNTFGRVPVIGSWIKSNIDSALNDARNAVLDAAKSSWGAARDMFNWASNLVFKVFAQLLAWFDAASTTIQHIATVQIPEYAIRAEAYASDAAGIVRADADSLFSRAETDIARALTTAQLDVSRAETAAIGYADQVYQQGRADLAAGLSAAEHFSAAQLAVARQALDTAIGDVQTATQAAVARLGAATDAELTQLRADLVNDVGRAEAIAASSLAAVRAGIYTDLDTWGDQAVRLAWPDWSGDIDALRRTLAGDFPWLNDLLGALGGLGAAGLAGALIRSMATSQALTRLATDCTVPVCRNLSQFGSELGGLAALFGSGLLFAWIAEGVADPSGWARDVNGVLAGVGIRTVDQAKATFGVG